MIKNHLDNRVSWQVICDRLISSKRNIILSSPTGTGKTERYEIWAMNKPERPIFITSPIKSLSNQKFREFLAKGYKVGLETGDIKYIPNDDCDIICCTQEIYNNKYKDLPNSTLIIDEFSYIFENENRSRAYIDSLYYSKAKNILICSATFGNNKFITDYLNRLTNRNFYLYENKERLTSLEYKGKISKHNIKNSLVIAYSKSKCVGIANEIYKTRISKLNQLVRNTANINDVKEKNKKQIINLAQKYNVDNKSLIEYTLLGLAYYHSGLYPKEKLFLEELFENKLIDTIVGTDALSLGVNFPIQNVIFTNFYKRTEKGFKMISKNLFEQISGRAGRKGFFDNGYVYYCNDFSETININGLNIDLSIPFQKLINSNENNVNISLTANIKNILNGNSTINDEANFIIKYSTEKKDFGVEKSKISNIINYIKSYDIVFSYLKREYHNLDWKSGYNKALEECSPEFIKKIDELSYNLALLQPYFDKDIGNAYLPEYTHKCNCEIFMDVLIETPLETLISKYGKTFYDVLLLKKYITNLPQKYSHIYNIKILDNLINSIDYTVLHPDKFKTEIKEFIKKNKPKPSLNRKRYECPNYFEKIIIDEHEYIKLFNYNDYIIACDTSSPTFSIHYFIYKTPMKTVGFIKNDERLDILSKIDINYLSDEEQDIIDKIEDAKTSLTKKRKK